MFTSISFDYTGKSQIVRLDPGYYIFECWGAEGRSHFGKLTNKAGNGAYTKGMIRISRKTTFYLFVGSYGFDGEIEQKDYAFNGGGGGQQSGGGASDVRLLNGNWDDFESLKSRIMVAAGGGGPDSGSSGGSGGCLEGINGNGAGGTQSSGGAGFKYGKFGKGGFADTYKCGGGGGGYYGGGTSFNELDFGGGGGSSFISGHFGCNAISKESTESNIVHLDSEFHYSGLYFTNTTMIDGNSEMPSPSSTTGKETGHLGNGSIRITQVGIIERITCAEKHVPSHFIRIASVMLLLCSC